MSRPLHHVLKVAQKLSELLVNVLHLLQMTAQVVNTVTITLATQTQKVFQDVRALVELESKQQ